MVHSYLSQMNPSGSDLATVNQLQRRAHSLLMKEVQISSGSTHMLPPHIRQLSVSVWQQEAIAQIYVQKTKGSVNV